MEPRFCGGGTVAWCPGHNSGKSLLCCDCPGPRGGCLFGGLSLRLSCRRSSAHSRRLSWHYKLPGLQPGWPIFPSPLLSAFPSRPLLPSTPGTSACLSSSRKSLLASLSLKPLSACRSPHSYTGRSFLSCPGLEREGRFQQYSMCGQVAGLAGKPVWHWVGCLTSLNG